MEKKKVLNLYPIDYPFETLVQRVKNRKLILDPDFQRKYKWDTDGNERASRFIESCLMRIPLPACYFAENEDNTQQVIDGVQRITTIGNFFDDKFALEGLSVYKELEGKKFSEIGDYKSDLETTTIRCIVLRKDNPKELIKEIFARLNQGAVQLTSQEIRHAIYSGPFNNMLEKLGRTQLITDFGKGVRGVSKKDGREADEIVLRFFALNGNLDDYDDNLSRYLDNYMQINKDLTEDSVREKEEYFNDTLQKCLTVFGDSVFKDTNKAKQKQALIHYDVLMWSFSHESAAFIETNKRQLANAFKQYCASEEFQRTTSGGTQKKSSILKRRTLWATRLDIIKSKPKPKLK